MSTPSRRQVLLWTLSGLGAACLGAVGCGQPGAGATEPFVPEIAEADLPTTRLGLAALLEAWFADASIPAIQAIGRAYLARFQPDVAAAVADLSLAIAPIAQIEDMTLALETLDAAVQADFEPVTAVASVAGWQLSATEARLCALADRLLPPG